MSKNKINMDNANKYTIWGIAIIFVVVLVAAIWSFMYSNTPTVTPSLEISTTTPPADNTGTSSLENSSTTASTALPVSDKVTKLAACLAAKKITMYGAYWCPHCQDQKKQFGAAWKYVPYVECTQDVNKCLANKVESYPTWIFPNGNRLVGTQDLAKLAAEAGCPF